MTTEGKLLVFGLLLIIGGSGWWYFNHEASAEVGATSETATTTSHLSFSIDGTPVMLINGSSSVPSAPGSASRTVTTYFGNEAKGDFNGDGKEDTAFLVTQQTGGSGTYYYVATSLGGPALVLGDRIAPQTTEWNDGKIIVNYADRKPGEPMTASPTVGMSRYFVVSNGELKETKGASSDTYGNVQGTVTLSPTCPVEQTPPEPACAPKAFLTEVTAIKKGGQEIAGHVKTTNTGTYNLALPLGSYILHASTTGMLPRCADKEITIRSSETITIDISCDSGIR
jgi:hypothetical protein